MEKLSKGLDNETQLLVGIGAAVASGCIPCLEKMVGLAEKASIDSKKLKAAAIVGQFVKDQPAAHMKAASDEILGTHLQAATPTTTCPAEVVEEDKQDCSCQEDTPAEPCC